jgi:hypothetical protein
MTEKDKADLERAATMIRDGQKLRRQVLGRIRQRTWRERERLKRAELEALAGKVSK